MNKFSPEQLEKLRNNPNIENATEFRVSYSKDFKKEAAQLLRAGNSMREILELKGIDPEILGKSRVHSLAHAIRNAPVDDDFGDKRKYNGFNRTSRSSEQRRISELEHQVAILTEEVEFLKKNLEADMEARMYWESQLLQP